MRDYSTALLQIISTEIREAELRELLPLPNHANRQPPPPHSYFCFETASACDSNRFTDHLQALRSALGTASGKLRELKKNGCEVSLLWFSQEKGAQHFLELNPEDMNFMASCGISFLCKTPKGK